MSPPLNEQEFLELCEYRKSMIPQYEIRDHLPGFERMEMMALWRIYGTEKMKWALRELGLHTGWKFRMLSKILDGSANVNYVPDFAKPATGLSQDPIPAHLEGPGKDDGAAIATNEQLREAFKKLMNK